MHSMNNIKYTFCVLTIIIQVSAMDFQFQLSLLHNHVQLNKTYSRSFRVMGFKIIMYRIGSTTFIWLLLNFFLTIIVSVLMDSVNITVCEFGEYYILLRTQIFFFFFFFYFIFYLLNFLFFFWGSYGFKF